MNGEDFLDIADRLLEGSSEAAWRSAVSRAYYGAFHAALRLFRRCGFVPPRSDRAHGYLWFRLENCGQADLEEVGRRLKHLRGSSNWADYDTDRFLDHAWAFDRVQVALGLVQVLNDVSADSAQRAAFTNAVRAYERDALKDVTWHPPP